MVKLTSEIFEKSQCLKHENDTVYAIERVLTDCGYTTSDTNKVIWSKGIKNVVLKLVDDWTYWVPGCAHDEQFPYCLSPNTLVITDNLINSITQFKVLQLPKSFFGIYSYTPAIRDFAPDRRYGFAANRFDHARIAALLELLSRDLPNGNLNEMYLTFNCAVAKGSVRSVLSGADLTSALDDYYFDIKNLSPTLREQYAEAFSFLKKVLPYNNVGSDFDNVMSKSWLNLVIETYVSEHTLSLSEKTFRALVTPAPSIIYGSRYNYVWLRNLGFDVLDDLVDTTFDSLTTATKSHDVFKHVTYITSVIGTYRRLAHMNFDTVSKRLNDAANHNVAVLENYKKQWPDDFAEWLDLLRRDLFKD